MITKRKPGAIFHPINPEDLAKLRTLPSKQYLEHIKFALLILEMDMLKDPGYTVNQRLQIIKAIKKYMPK